MHLLPLRPVQMLRMSAGATLQRKHLLTRIDIGQHPFGQPCPMCLHLTKLDSKTILSLHRTDLWRSYSTVDLRFLVSGIRSTSGRDPASCILHPRNADPQVNTKQYRPQDDTR